MNKFTELFSRITSKYLFIFLTIVFIVQSSTLYNFSIVGLLPFILLNSFFIIDFNKFDDFNIFLLLGISIINIINYIILIDTSFLFIIACIFFLFLSANYKLSKINIKIIFYLLFFYLNILLFISIYKYLIGSPGTENIFGVINGYDGYFGFSYMASTRNDESLYWAFLFYLSLLLPNFINISKFSLYVIRIFYFFIIFLTLSRSCIISTVIVLFIINFSNIRFKFNFKYLIIYLFLFISFLLILIVLDNFRYFNSSNFERIEIYKLFLNSFTLFNTTNSIKSILFFKFNDYVWNDSLFLDLFYLYGFFSIIIFYPIFKYLLIILQKKIQYYYYFPLFIFIFSFFNSSYLSLNFFFLLGISFLFINCLKISDESSC